MNATTNGASQPMSAPELSYQRTNSFAQHSEASETAQEFISNQLRLEADAREALPYQFDTCTRSLGPIRQSLYSCLTCNPPPSDPTQPYTGAGVCYSCSISCHGEHVLVELFTRRDFVCNCGTTKLPSTSPCSLRPNPATGSRDGVHSEEPSASNTYNHNFQNRFCGCGEEYDAHSEKGTMFQCMGLATEAEGGCGEDWWHPECLMGLGRDWYLKGDATKATANGDTGKLETVKEEVEDSHEPQSNDSADNNHPILDPPAVDGGADSAPTPHEVAEDEGHPMPSGFPAEESFEHFICYKCTSVHPWIKRYAGSPGFLPAVPFSEARSANKKPGTAAPNTEQDQSLAATAPISDTTASSLKRKAEDDADDSSDLKRAKTEDASSANQPLAPSTSAPPTCTYTSLPTAPNTPISLFVTPTFRSHLCRCPTHFPLLTPHTYLLDEELAYEPPLSASSASHSPNDNDDTHSRHSGSSARSLLDRGEAALSNMDRVRAIEGVMADHRMKDKVKEFLKPFAESGTPVGAEDIKRYFEKLRGDDEAIRGAREGREGAGAGVEE